MPFGREVLAYVVPFRAQEPGTGLVRRTLGVVDIVGARPVPMLYSSFARPFGAGLVSAGTRRYDAVALGSTGGGVCAGGLDRVRTLSGGQQRRLDLGLALIGGVLTGIPLARVAPALEEARGPLSEELGLAIGSRTLSISIAARITVTLGVVFLMVRKPELVESLFVIVLAVLAGLGVGFTPGAGRRRSAKASTRPSASG